MSGHLPRWGFLRLLGLVVVAAFGSLWVQVHGLVGEDGVVPATASLPRYAAWLAEQGQWKWAQMPTLGWWAAGNTALHVYCGLGTLAGLGLVVGLAPRLCLVVAWGLYLSLFHLGGPFLSFQWDILLLETLVLAIPYAPPGLWPRLATEEPPSRLAVWGLRLLLVKLMFASGVVKLTSGDPSWLDGTAMDFHYWTQPLPTGLAWSAHNAPAWTHTLAVSGTFVVELFVPLLILCRVRGWRLGLFGAAALLAVGWGDADGLLGRVPWLAALALLLDDRVLGRVRPSWVGRPSTARWPAFIAIVGLMVSISATGNYGFFQLLTVALCLPLLDDHALARLRPPRDASGPPGRWTRRLALAFALVTLPISALQATRLLKDHAPAWVVSVREAVLDVSQPFASVNSYGLFATMTKQRIELVIEGTTDGTTWRPYVFAWKPHDPAHLGPVAGLHMPRLDWQLWFAALRPRCRSGWYLGLMDALLRGAPAVTDLLAENPFGDTPPIAVRTLRFDYTLTSAAERAASGAVWHIRPAGDYCPVLTRAMLKEND